ncbi:MAG: hypothetical protein NT049_07365 [Planctomycetota bacterium]|nr:hypothetical protein [Planctomycetota bacterium]
MKLWTLVTAGGMIGCLVLGLAACAAPAAEPAAAKAERPSFSGVYPQLAVTNGGASESGIGAVVPWAGKLWFLTYPAHVFKGGNDKLYELDVALNLVARPESVGGTHANRMIHRESNQLIIGPYFIDAKGAVRAISQDVMPGRMTAVTRHLTDPAGKVYFATMEEGFYEVDVKTLAVKELHKDRNVGGKNMLPGVHGKGCYTGQGRLFYANNGNGGVLAEWDGTKDIGSLDSWTIVDRNKYTDITSPGGIYGAPDDAAPNWAIVWDSKSDLLNVRDAGKWTRFRLPKASYTQDADHGWYTEWPRIREVSGGRLLMNKHDMFYDFPKTFRPGKAVGIRPISTFLKMVVDYTDWDGRLVMVDNDASRQGNPILGCPESNAWFGKWDDLRTFGRPAGWGGVWVKDPVKAGEPSEPFLLAGFERRVAHLLNDGDAPVEFTLETDAAGDGKWAKLATVAVPAGGYAYYVIAPGTQGEWIRVKTDRDVKSATAYFHYSAAGQTAEPALFRSLAAADQTARRSEGILHCAEGEAMVLQFAATVTDDSGKAAETGYYVMGADLKLRRTSDSAAEKTVREKWATKQDISVDAASVIYENKKNARYRLPKGPDALCGPSAAGWPRGVREIVTERNMLSACGTIYELPREDSGGILKVRPITTHNRRIFDFASWRGLLVLAGNLAGAAADGHYVASDDGKVGLWLGNVEDLWKLGPPRGEGGPWKDAAVKAGEPSDPYLMTGYDRKAVQLSHDGKGDVKFTLEVDFLATGHFHTYDTITAPAGKTITHTFPAGFAAHWVRVKADTGCKATAWFVYDVAEKNP